MFDLFTYCIIIILMFISAQYSFHLLFAFALSVFFLFYSSWWNLILLGMYVFTFVIFGGSLSGSGMVIVIVLLIIILISNIFIKKQPKEEEPGMDFSKLFGGGAGME